MVVALVSWADNLEINKRGADKNICFWKILIDSDWRELNHKRIEARLPWKHNSFLIGQNIFDRFITCLTLFYR